MNSENFLDHLRVSKECRWRQLSFRRIAFIRFFVDGQSLVRSESVHLRAAPEQQQRRHSGPRSGPTEWDRERPLYVTGGRDAHGNLAVLQYGD